MTRLLFGALPFVIALLTQQVPPYSTTYGAFGFANPAGTEFIVTNDVPTPERLRSAICSGDVIPIAFSRAQKGKGADRTSPAQFASLTGAVFSVATARANPEDACLLVPQTLLAEARVLKTQSTPDPARCSAEALRRLAALRERRIQGCWSLGAVPSRGSISAVGYVHQGSDALASTVIEIDGRVLFIDHPAKFTKPGEDVWRADDEGRFSGEGISVPFLIQQSNIFAIPMRWNGFEGVSLSIHVSDATGSQTKGVLTDYWYRAAR